MNWLRSAFFFTLLLIGTNQIRSQQVSTAIEKRIDSLFSKWNAKTPGCAIGIVKDDQLIFSKGYGMANLEYAIPITKSTIFHMASVSKQFTAWSVILLAAKGQLSIEDDVRKYLDWFPDLGKISIRNLFNHTSGIRDQWQLLAMEGKRDEDLITQDDIIRVLRKQKGLNFPPGERYMYSNSGYTMLSEIVKKVSGRNLREFEDSAIFKPLGMLNTHVHDDAGMIVPNRAYSYGSSNDTTYKNATLTFSNSGATSMFTNVEDISKWIQYFYRHDTSLNKSFGELLQKGKLNNGNVLNYASGIAVDSYRGYLRYGHSGGDAGFRTYISIFPEQKMGFIVLSNFGDVNTTQLATKMADLFLPDKFPKPLSMPVRDSARAVIKDQKNIQAFTGDYISDEGVILKLKLEKSRLLAELYGNSRMLIPIKKDSFLLAGFTDKTLVVKIAGKDTVIDQYNQDVNLHYVKFNPIFNLSDDQLKKYTGTYSSPEVVGNYRISFKDHQLYMSGDFFPETLIELLTPELLATDISGVNHFQMIRETTGNYVGFEVNSGRVRHLVFEKVQ